MGYGTTQDFERASGMEGKYAIVGNYSLSHTIVSQTLIPNPGHDIEGISDQAVPYRIVALKFHNALLLARKSPDRPRSSPQL